LLDPFWWDLLLARFVQQLGLFSSGAERSPLQAELAPAAASDSEQGLEADHLPAVFLSLTHCNW